MREYWGVATFFHLLLRESVFRRGWLMPHRPKMNPVSMVGPSVNAELMSFNMIGVHKLNQGLNGGVALFRQLQRTAHSKTFLAKEWLDERL